MNAPVRPKVLCVDDEPAVLEGLTLHLRRRFEVFTANGGAAGLQVLEQTPDMAVLVSDMRMPGMDGAAFLKRAKEALPDTTRVLLTGHADLDAAMAAINQGAIFRFITKPCPPPLLLETVTAAAEHHRLVSAEKVLLEQTLRGSIAALIEVLSLADPLSFGEAQRVQRRVSRLAEKLNLPQRWQVEMAAMLAPLGRVALPREVVEKLSSQRALTPAEQRAADQVPELTQHMLAHIPRLEEVRAILAAAARAARLVTMADERTLALERAAQVLKVAADYDRLESSGAARPAALGSLALRPERYDPEVVRALADLLGECAQAGEEREVRVDGLRLGMVLLEDVRFQNGALLVSRGFEVTKSFLEKVRNFAPGQVKEPVRVKLAG